MNSRRRQRNEAQAMLVALCSPESEYNPKEMVSTISMEVPVVNAFHIRKGAAKPRFDQCATVNGAVGKEKHKEKLCAVILHMQEQSKFRIHVENQTSAVQAQDL